MRDSKTSKVASPQLPVIRQEVVERYDRPHPEVTWHLRGEVNRSQNKDKDGQ